ncbi:MAG: AAA family ATPase [Synergistaceae bacterium]|nr:AAA family ATPase [Synergistaceae bacterium]
MIIKRIQLKNWKNFGDVCAECGKRVFIIGPNASGKSNFLDALRFLRDIVQDGLKKAVAVRGGMKAVRYLCARKQPDVSIAVNLSDTWEYELSFKDRNGEPRITKENVHLTESGKTTQLLMRPNSDDKADEMRLSQTALQQINANKDFRAIADFFSSIQYRHILPQLVRDPQNFSPSPSKNDPYGRDLVSQIWNTPQKTRDARLKKINEALTIAVPQLSNLSVEQDKATGLPHLKVNYEHWRTYGAYQNEAAFSDGTLRLLTLLWSIFDATEDHPLLLEEPELSLHEDIIRQLPGIFARLDRTRKKARQIFITTHAEAMLSMPGIGANEVLRLEQAAEGTIIRTADEQDIELMNGGLSAAEVFLPKTRPPRVEQLPLLF